MFPALICRDRIHGVLHTPQAMLLFFCRGERITVVWVGSWSSAGLFSVCGGGQDLGTSGGELFVISQTRTGNWHFSERASECLFSCESVVQIKQGAAGHCTENPPSFCIYPEGNIFSEIRYQKSLSL